jgi:transcriptional regulator ATRX
MLTGTPLQINMFEFFTMVEFVHPYILIYLEQKRNSGENFEKKLMKGQSLDLTNFEVRAMKRRALILHKMLESIILKFFDLQVDLI